MSSFSGNTFTRTFDLEVPIVQGPMGGVAGPELVAAVANSGGLGMLPIWTQSTDLAANDIAETQALTDRSFGVNLRADLVQLELIELAIDAGVRIFHLFWGDPAASMAPIRSAGAKMIATIGDADAARSALDAGASALVAQGVEAGGHVLSDLPLAGLLADVVPLTHDVPVIAAGGLGDAESVCRVIDSGASGALLGTRFVATEESQAHDEYKQALIAAASGSTVRSECFDIGWPRAPHRNLRNSTFTAWEAAGRPEPGSHPGEGDIVLRSAEVEIPRYSAVPPRRDMQGDIDAAVLYAGTGVDMVVDCPRASEIVDELASLLEVPRGNP
jgi:NAD(P)H-dependent flavin oxidoreductase YrpB (nitropropane dioxygenase family)